MPASDWAGAPYVRIYSTLSADHRAVWNDDRLLAAYVRLLMAADAAWPGLATLPRRIADDTVADLVREEVIDVDGDLYHFHGLDDERSTRARRGQIGGIVRAHTAERDSLGRFAGASLEEASTNGAAPVATSVVPVAGTSSIPASPPTEPARPQGGRGSERSTTPARTRAREDDDVPRFGRRPPPDPAAIACTDYNGHRSAHQWWEGIGWKCMTCERARADAEPTFRERVARHVPEDDPF